MFLSDKEKPDTLEEFVTNIIFAGYADILNEDCDITIGPFVDAQPTNNDIIELSRHPMFLRLYGYYVSNFRRVRNK